MSESPAGLRLPQLKAVDVVSSSTLPRRTSLNSVIESKGGGGGGSAPGPNLLGSLIDHIHVSNHERSDRKLDLEQRISKLELDHFPAHHDHTHFAHDDAERYSDMTLDEYMDYAKTLDLPQLQAHHSKLFKLVRQYQGLFSVASAISVEIDSNGALARIVSGVHRIEGEVVTHGKAMMIDDAPNDARFDATLDTLSNFTTRNVLCAPVTDPQGNIMAVLQCANKAAPFTSSDCLSLELIALIAGHTLHKLELFDSAMSAGRRTSAILQVVKAVADENHDTHGMILRVVQVAKDALNCDRLTLYLCNSVRRELVCCVCRDSMVDRFCLPYGKGLAGHVATTGKLLRIANCYDDPRFHPDVDVKSGYKSVSMLCAPVISADGDTIAVLQAMNKSSWPIPSNFTGTVPSASITAFLDSDVALLTAFCTDSVTLMVSSLLGVHSNEKGMSHSWSRKGWKISGLVSLAATKFMNSLAKRRSEPFVPDAAAAASLGRGSVGRGSEGKSSSHETLHTVSAEWRSKQHGFDDFTFDIFTYTHDQLAVLVVQGFTQMGLCSIFSIPDEIAVRFVDTVRRGYRDNPYHSWWHAVDVYQHVFALLNRTHLLSMLQPNIVFAMLVAALCHDIGHPGTDNAYEIATGSALAIQYNDMSVLEQHHASETFRILHLPACNILLGVSKPGYQTIRKLVIDGILQTDMKCHFDLVHDLEDAVTLSQSISSVVRRQKNLDMFDIANATHVKWLTGAILHASDIGAQTYPVAIAGQWYVYVKVFDLLTITHPRMHASIQTRSNRLVDEFRLLGEKERSEGLPVAPFRDNLTTSKAVGRLQLNFINYIVTPIWHLLIDMFPDAGVLRVNLDENRMHFQNLILEDAPKLSSSGGSDPLLATALSASRLSKPELRRSNSNDSDIVLNQQLHHQLSMIMDAPPKIRRSQTFGRHTNQHLRYLHASSSQANVSTPYLYATRPPSLGSTCSKDSLHRPPSMPRILSSNTSQATVSSNDGGDKMNIAQMTFDKPA
ncbi:hypothetical protein DYB28_000057 [Aphanomyces astaci]|uniref:Phosphodiesterase n=3 Tax=Aphanomyces astaci TaxID=112090 RepID=A0A397BM03_APHAT|nr:hypothetical protein DYB25_000892 [Aphanomyces astaci]RHY82059.1 hypothetical protein DYB31_007260 [Aphanomyces astaci]RLO07294.1 hypothetical protein DYB28_000057 [Aphanomyces astaci]